jgi:hypothetical protein
MDFFTTSRVVMLINSSWQAATSRSALEESLRALIGPIQVDTCLTKPTGAPSHKASVGTRETREQWCKKAANHDCRVIGHCLQRNLETTKPNCEASEFQGSRESRRGVGRPMGEYWCSLSALSNGRTERRGPPAFAPVILFGSFLTVNSPPWQRRCH